MPDDLSQAPRPARFAIRVDPLFRGLFSVLGAAPARDAVVVGPQSLGVRLGWLFRSDIARSAVAGARLHADMVGGWGAHGWRGRWLVNGSSTGIVQVDLLVPQRAWVLGVWPISLRTLYVSLAEPQGFLEALDPPPGSE